MPALKNYSKSSLYCKCILAAILLAGAMFSTAFGQQTPEEKKAALWNAAMGAFNKGDYAGAITGFEAIIPLATPDDNIEGVYFYLGAAYFNSQDYDKAVTTFKTFQTKYPKSARILEVLYSIAQAEMMSKQYPDAITYFKMVEDVPEYHEFALYYEGVCYKSTEGTDKTDDAIAVLEKLVLPEIRSSTAANGAILLVELYAKKKEFDKASDMIKQLRKKLYYVDDLMALNHQAIELGDGCMEDGLAEQALLCYRMVRSREEVIAFQIEKIKTMAQKIAYDTSAMQMDKDNALKYAREISQLRRDIVAGNKRLEQYKTEADIKPAVLLRIGRAYYQMHRPWESIVAFSELLDKYPDAQEYESALFAITVSCAEAIRPAATKQYAAEYVKKYPQGKHIVDVKYLVGLAAAQAEDWQAVADAFGAALKDPGENKWKEDMEMQLGNAYFALSRFDDAANTYSQYLKDYGPPNNSGSHIEEATYRYALTFVFAGHYEDAMTHLNDYLTNFPKGAFVADAKYRLDICKYAANLFDDVIKDCRQWEHDYSKDPKDDSLLPEVLALLADSLDAADKEDEAVQDYIRSAQLSVRDETREYALGAAEKLLRKQGDWEKISQMCEDFIKQHPDNSFVPQAAYWDARARVHEGKTDEAKKFMAETILKYIDDPRRDAVEQLLTQLAQTCVRKKKPTPSPSPSAAVVSGTSTSGTSGKVAVATPTPAPTPSPTPEVAAVPEDPGAELDKLLGRAEQDTTPTAKARIYFAKAQLAFMRHDIPEQEKNYQAIVDNFKPEDLSSVILAFVGDYLLSKHEDAKAKAYFDYLMDEYPKSDMLDYAYNGLAQIAYDSGDFQKALRYYDDAINNGIASGKLKELTVGRARTLLKTKKYDLALDAFKEVAGNREWKGVLTAESIFDMGDVEQQQAKFNDAIAYYQRVYVAYTRYPEWVAKAYLQSGECFEKLGKVTEAINTYKEMLGNDKVLKFPEADEARKRLQALGAGGTVGTTVLPK